jgi:hypothetical protein
VSSDLDDTRRAARLLRWYPAAWRECYGEEFGDHLEQEFAERPVDIGRTVNIAYKGLVARVADVGLSNADASTEGRTRAAVGTSFVLTALMAVLALNFWSRAMGMWGGRRYHPVPDSVATGILTVATGLLLMVLVAIVLAVAVFVVRQIVRGRAQPLVGPSILAVGSGALLLYAVRQLPTMLVQYERGSHGIPGVRWSQPGRAIEALAQITWELTQRWVALWNQGATSTPTVQTVVNDLLPLALLVFGVAIALLVRRVELPRTGERLGSATVALLGTLTGTFFVTYLVWLTVGGPSGTHFFVPEGSAAGGVDLVLLALFAMLVGRSGLSLSPRCSLVEGRTFYVGGKNDR